MKRIIIISSLVLSAFLIIFLILKKFNVNLNPFGLPYAEPFTYELIYDESHSNLWGIWDTGYLGYSECARILRKHGILVSVNNDPLEQLIGKIKEARIDKTILLLNFAKYQEYSDIEITAVTKFIKSGGKLFVLGEAKNQFDSAFFQNTLIKNFIMMVDKNQIANFIPKQKYDNPMYTHNCTAFSEIFGLDRIMHLTSASIWCGKGCVTLLEAEVEYKRHLLGLGKIIGRGRLVVLGDSKLFLNADENIGISQGDNRSFFIKCIEWLIQKSLDTASPQAVRLKSSGGQKRAKVFIDTSSMGRGIDDSFSGIKNFAQLLADAGYEVLCGESVPDYDVRIVAALQKIKIKAAGSKRLIVFAESFMQLQRSTRYGKHYLIMQAKNPESIYSDVEKIYAVSVLPCFLTDGGINTGYFDCKINAVKSKIILHRSAALECKDESLKKWVVPSGKIWGEIYHPGIDYKSTGISKDKWSDISSPVWAAYNEKLLIFGDSDLISNQNSNKSYFKPFVEAIIDWIEKRSHKL